jgi:predicted phosphodiesterase
MRHGMGQPLHRAMRPRRIAVLSDVHGNLTSLQAVLADAAAVGAEEIVVAGDTVNFGPSSAAVVDLLRQRGARMIRGNHEVELVATYGTPQAPPGLASSPSFAMARFTNEQLGAERRAFLTALPDRLSLDEATIVVHGSPRRNRDGVTVARSEDELRTYWNDDPARLCFTGHTHRPVVRDVPASSTGPMRRFVNVGSAGFNLDGDTRVAYAIADRAPDGAPGNWQVEIRRVVYDLDKSIAEYGNGYRDACGGIADILIRQLRTANSYFGPWVRGIQGLPDEEIIPSVTRFLDENP